MSEDNGKSAIIARMAAANRRRTEESEALRAEEKRVRAEIAAQERLARRDWEAALRRIATVVDDTNNLLKAAEARLNFTKANEPVTGGTIAVFHLYFAVSSKGVNRRIAARIEALDDGQTRIAVGEKDAQPLQSFTFRTAEMLEPQIDEAVTALLKHSERP